MLNPYPYKLTLWSKDHHATKSSYDYSCVGSTITEVHVSIVDLQTRKHYCRLSNYSYSYSQGIISFQWPAALLIPLHATDFCVDCINNKEAFMMRNVIVVHFLFNCWYTEHTRWKHSPRVVMWCDKFSHLSFATYSTSSTAIFVLTIFEPQLVNTLPNMNQITISNLLESQVFKKVVSLATIDMAPHRQENNSGLAQCS